MNGPFPRIGIFTKPTGEGIVSTLKLTCDFLQNRGHKIILDEISAQRMPSDLPVVPANKIGAECDLVIVIGGDGSLLKAARATAANQVPILGINGGTLGFLADVKPQHISHTLGAILDGEYYEEFRTMLRATIVQRGITSEPQLALNEVVIHHGDIARLIEFQVFINDVFVVAQRADGLITSTPTGSTAYALSGGGPIVYPTLKVLTLMPMFPHALNTRPIVIDDNSKIRLVIDPSNTIDAKFSCDGQTHISLMPGDEVLIQANPNHLRLLHPKTYNYFAVLREKLGWNLHPKE
ncbi:MAG TPA: NAD(+) kinase [Gammaproteobacteria bacterium]|nr:NAD(+) kinase [Gammaproteobacteria bacterium]